MKRRGRPRYADARPEILCVGIVIGSAFRAESSASRNIHNCRPVQDFVHDRVIFVAQSEVESEFRFDPEFILTVELIKRSPVSYDAFSLKVGRGIRLVVDEVVQACIGDRRRRERVAGMRRTSTPNFNVCRPTIFVRSSI